MRSTALEMNIAVTSAKTAALVFALNDNKGGKGTLTLTLPAKSRSSKSIRATRATKAASGRCSTRNGSSPRNSPAAAFFQAAASGRQFITLILQGRGRSCTTAEDFSHWTLVIDAR